MQALRNRDQRQMLNNILQNNLDITPISLAVNQLNAKKPQFNVKARQKWSILLLVEARLSIGTNQFSVTNFGADFYRFSVADLRLFPRAKRPWRRLHLADIDQSQCM